MTGIEYFINFIRSQRVSAITDDGYKMVEYDTVDLGKKRIGYKIEETNAIFVFDSETQDFLGVIKY